MRRITKYVIQEVHGRLPVCFSQTLAPLTSLIPSKPQPVSSRTFYASAEPAPCFFCHSLPNFHSWRLFYSSLAPSPAINLQRKTEEDLSSNLEGDVEGEKCWSCGSNAPPGAFLLCPSCNAVQPLNPTVDYFEIFNMAKVYDLDLKELEKRYKGLQKKLHPDLFGLKSEREREYSAEQSAQVIKAYHTLLPPLSRATYMLHIQGIDVEEEGTVEDVDLLMEIMEMQEAVEATTDVAKLQIFLNKIIIVDTV
ncbi:hypothetical protein O6H91_01G115600 [Diphasiastrum complanatum]|uniref:Uncharacterized protein n=1 Tax=Diphasiastrum complanatum TaxID=34168 RepID=A0ACC2EV36_DIPCM|nr:hypothetical protein O6H91_01G115600 [Diphasiastrum complanatum]